ncbi:MAG: sugar transferase [Lachnospiraceae bacterium]|nr:sugar transferase [Lachnospiraceae bacterium]
MNQIYRKSKVIKIYSLLLIDLFSLLISYLAALLFRFGDLEVDGHQEMYLSYGIFLLVLTLLYSVLTDWNRDFFERGFFKEMIAVGKYNVVLVLMSSTFLVLTKNGDTFARLVMIYFAALNVCFSYLFHLAFKEYMLKHYKKSINSDKLMVITQEKDAEKVVNQILKEKHWNYELTSITIMDADKIGEEVLGIPVVADKNNVIEVATQNILDRVFISLPRTEISEIKHMILEFEAMGILCHYNMELEELNLEGKEAGTFAGFSVISFSLQNMDYRRLMIKRVMDVVGSIFGLCITAVVFPFVALAIKAESKGPVIFKQERIGKNGRRFKMYKFRSMYVDAEKRLAELQEKNEVQGLMFKMENDPRITKVGKFLRKTSLDELPQFWNVLKGDMSLVGTRPPTVNEFEKYNAHYRRRLCITPGLTGMWQVNGRSDIKNFDDVVAMDLKYIDEWSLRLDVKLLLQTVGVVLFRRGSK